MPKLKNNRKINEEILNCLSKNILFRQFFYKQTIAGSSKK